jgi:hypothetical protein
MHQPPTHLEVRRLGAEDERVREVAARVRGRAWSAPLCAPLALPLRWRLIRISGAQVEAHVGVLRIVERRSQGECAPLRRDDRHLKYAVCPNLWGPNLW